MIKKKVARRKDLHLKMNALPLHKKKGGVKLLILKARF